MTAARHDVQNGLSHMKLEFLIWVLTCACLLGPVACTTRGCNRCAFLYHFKSPYAYNMTRCLRNTLNVKSRVYLVYHKCPIGEDRIQPKRKGEKEK